MKARRRKVSNGDQRAAHCSTPDLPIAVVMEILSRLPIKTLMAAKCVCKSWRDFISGDTHFAKLHLSRSSTELLLRSLSHSTVLYLGNIDFHSNSVSRESSPLFDLPSLRGRTRTRNWYFMQFMTEIFYVNTCNGFVCFSNDYHSPRTYAMICNPVTGEFITVTGPAKEENGLKCAGYVLGFSGKANRYKVLRLLMGKETSYDQFVEICTLEKGSAWRNVGDCPYFIGKVDDKDFVFLEGKVHFLTKNNSIIACFDFDSEQFQQVPLPPIGFDFDSEQQVPLPPIEDDISEDEGVMGGIGVLEGSLFINDSSLSTSDIWVMKEYDVKDSWTKASDIWVMKEYDVKDSWTKAFTYPCLFQMGIKMPLKYLDDGEILMLDYTHLVSYNPATHFSLGAYTKARQVIAYRPSLIRLKDALMGYDALVLNAKPRWRERGCEGSSSGK